MVVIYLFNDEGGESEVIPFEAPRLLSIRRVSRGAVA